MTRFRVKTQEVGGLVKLVLVEGEQVLGMVTVPWMTYERVMRDVVTGVRKLALEALVEFLGPTIWRDAQAHADGSAELAKQRLEALGLMQPTLDALAELLSRAIAERLTSHLPEIVG